MDINNIIEYDSHYNDRAIKNSRHKGKDKVHPRKSQKVQSGSEGISLLLL